MVSGAHRQRSVVRAVDAFLGPCELIRDLSWSLELATVLELRLQNGEAVIAKSHADHDLFLAEVDAYRRWVPAIADRAPRLLGVNEEHQVLVLSRLQGRSPAGLSPEETLIAHQDAGYVLRRLHAAEPPRPEPEWASHREKNLRRWLAEAPKGLLDAADVAWALEQVAGLRKLPTPTVVPCHGDWQPRNWLVDDHLRVFAFDFERARLSWWIHDLQRLIWQEWASMPPLMAAFLDGYGRDLTEYELEGLWCNTAAGHLVQIVWATTNGDLGYADEGRNHLREMRSGGARRRFMERLTHRSPTR